ncbi:MAG: hypothetical protein CME70_12930 [Halobacteriovorax sp.]|nr:hypothetical protein [Halobacteriovorax sp.]|tara:strand:+ start:150840 stop:152009 length:1170 start_codon:yes stop_codon:yes gene_type:complete
MKITIVGAGFSGLTLAHYLRNEGFGVEVLEANSHAGGLIKTVRTKHGLIETAATSILLTPTLEKILKDINLPPLMPNKESKKRYISKNLKPSRLPLSLKACIQLFIGVLRISFAKKKWQPKGLETLSEWADRTFGKEVRKALVSPAMQGIYAASSEELSASLVLKKIFSKEKRERSKGPINFKNGMGEFIHSLESSLKARGVSFKYNEKLTKEKLPKGPVVLATSMKAAQSLIDGIPDIPKKNMTSLTAFFDTPPPIRGFGILFPVEEGLNAHGVLLNDCMFKGRAKEGHSETWILSELSHLSKDELLELVKEDRRKVFASSEEPTFYQVSSWNEAFPIYGTKLEKYLKNNNQRLDNIFLTGNYLGNLGLSGILDQNQKLSKRLKEELL